MKRYEHWKPISGYEGLYEVSSFGRVRSLDRVVKKKCRGGQTAVCLYNGKLLKLATNCNYLTVQLNKNGTGKTHAVHRLVARAFIPNPKSLPQVNHKDENKWNNCVENLEWCDGHYNCTYGTIIERKRQRVSGEGNPRCQLTEIAVREIRELHKQGLSNSTLGTQFGVSPDTIYQIVTKRRWKHIE